MLTPPARML